MIFEWLGFTGNNVMVLKTIASICSFGALILTIVFYIMWSTTNYKNKVYIRISALFGISMGVLGLFGFGSMWYLDVLIIAMNLFTYYNNRDV